MAKVMDWRVIGIYPGAMNRDPVISFLTPGGQVREVLLTEPELLTIIQSAAERLQEIRRATP